jgi:hypothetical protein
METKIVTSKEVSQRLGTLLLDLKYKPEDIILVEKVGSDDYVAVLCNPQFLRDEGVDIPEKGKVESKPDVIKKK